MINYNMIIIVNNSKDLYKATMTPKLINLLNQWKIEYHIINKKSDLSLVTNSSLIKGIILTGGPLCISDNVYYKDIIKNITTIQLFPDIPILGICFGFQIITDIFGGSICKLPEHNLGFKEVSIKDSNMSLFNNIKDINVYFFSHNDQISQVPPNFKYFISDDIIISIEHYTKKIFGVQFHPEGSTDGHNVIKNFIFNQCYI